MQQRKALGRGLDTLIPAGEVSVIPTDIIRPPVGVKTVPVEAIVPSRFQPRRSFDEEKIKELASSIREQGVIQPLIVASAVGGKYELVAGERRLRAAKIAGLTEVPVVVKNVDTETMLEQSLVENIQREDLNPIEEASACKELIEQFDYTQDEAADRLGKSRVYVANSLRLLNLPKVIQDDVAGGRMTAGHARALLGVGDLGELLKIREKVIRNTLTVRDVERMVQSSKGPARERVTALTPQMRYLVDELTKTLATKVRLEPDKRKKGGKLIIEYYSPQDLDRIYSRVIGNG